jgi:hypothetical protein
MMTVCLEAKQKLPREGWGGSLLSFTIHVGAAEGPVFCGFYADIHSCCVFMISVAMQCLHGNVSQHSPTSSDSYGLSIHPVMSTGPLKDDMYRLVPIQAEYPVFIYAQHFDHCESSLAKSFFDQD